MVRPTNGLTILVGLPGSGKSTLAAKYARVGAVVVSPDSIRARILGKPNDDFSPKPFDSEIEVAVWWEASFATSEALRAGYHVVFDSTALTSRKRDEISFIAWEARRPWRFLVLPFDPETCRARRGKQIPASDLEGMIARYEEPTPDEGPVEFV